MGAPTAYTMPPPMMAAEPPEASSIKSMLHIARILALIFGIILLLVGIVSLAAAFIFVGFVIFSALFIIWGIVDFVIYTQLKQIEAMVNQHQYEAAKSKTLVWMIIGFIIGGIIVGILILVAWLKFDPLINWQRSQMQGGVPPMGYASPSYAAPPPAPAPMAPPAAPPAAQAAPLCPKCGRPTTYIPQYGRYYCYTDNLYV